MSTISTINTLVPNASVPQGYFDEDNIVFIQSKIAEVLRREFKQTIQFDRASIIRLMDRAILDRIESVPKMNQRVVMFATNEFRNHQVEANRNFNWETNYSQSQKLYDHTAEINRYDQQNIKLANRLGYPSVGGTMRFYFS